jgi:hypothetical protein
MHLFRGSGSLRQRRAAKEVARSSAEWGNPFGVCYDREVWYVSRFGVTVGIINHLLIWFYVSRILRCHEHPHLDQTRG